MLNYTRLERSLEKVDRLEALKENLEKKVDGLKNKILSLYGNGNEEALVEEKIPNEMEKKIKSLESEIRILKSIHQKEKYSVKHDIKFCKKYTKDIFELIIQKLKEERRKSLYYEKDIERLKKDLSYLERINKDYSGSSFKLNLEPFKSIMNIHEKTDNNVKQVEEKPKVSKYHKKKYEKENHSKKIGVENIHGSTVFLSPIKPAEEDEEDIKKLEISEIEKESMEIERRINKLKEKSKKYGREYSGRKIIQ